MYDWPEIRTQTDALWCQFRSSFANHGFDPPPQLTRCDDESACWLKPDLFFSQTCGYPYITQLCGGVALLGTPHFDIEGWDGPYYSSAIVVRRDATLESLTKGNGSHFVYNSKNSLSGFRCLGPGIGAPDKWFDRISCSGGHRWSAAMVSQGEADIAAIDAMCWHLFQTHEPGLASNLKVLEWTPPLAALPYITNAFWGEEKLSKLQLALSEAINGLQCNGDPGGLHLSGISLLNVNDYQSIKSL